MIPDSRFQIPKIISLLLDLLCLAAFGLAFCTVFQTDPTLANGIVSSKYFWFYGAMGILSLCVLLRYLAFKPVRFHFSIVDLLVLCVCFINLFVSWSRQDAFSTRTILLVLCGFLYFYFRLFLTEQPRSRLVLLLIIMATAGIEAVWGLRQLYGFTLSHHHLFRTTGSFFNSGPFAGYLAVVMPMVFLVYDSKFTPKSPKGDLKTATQLRRSKSPSGDLGVVIRKALEIWCTLVFLTILIILPATMSRASWLAAIGGCAVAGVCYLLKNERYKDYITAHRKKIRLLAAAAGVCLLLGVVGMYFLKKDSADGRLLMWKIAWQAIPKAPGGVGLGYFPGIYGEAQADYFAAGKGSPQEEYVAGSPEYGFNEYLQICLEQGIAGLLLFLAIVGIALYTGYRNGRIAEISGLIALLIFAAMSYPFSVLPFVILLAFLLAACVSDADDAAKVAKRPAVIQILLVVSVLGVVYCLYDRYPTRQAYREWNSAKMLYHSGLYREVADSYLRLEPLLDDQVSFLFEEGRSLAQSGDYAGSNRVLLKGTRLSADPMFHNILGKNYQALQQYDSAETHLIKAANITPNRLYPYYLLANMYLEAGDTLKAREAARIVLETAPKVHSQAVDEMRDELRKIGDINKR